MLRVQPMEIRMRKTILIALAAATALTTPGYALAREHGRHEVRKSDHERKVERKHRRNYVVYVAPHRSWRYRPLYVGYRLQPEFYGSRYYISNYGAYGVGFPGRDRRWIRYGDDLLLVNLRTGRVLRIVPNVFW
jgi:Ni/Co efflux regulator RcnB